MDDEKEKLTGVVAHLLHVTCSPLREYKKAINRLRKRVC